MKGSQTTPDNVIVSIQIRGLKLPICVTLAT